MSKQFAEKFPRTPEGWIKFPVDKPERTRMGFVPESQSHPAKANIYMIREIYRYVAEPGETIMDITSGIGTLMIAEKEGYHTILIEIEEPFHKIQVANAEALGVRPAMLHGDCREFLPLPCDHIIFSPPYSLTLNRKGKLTPAMEKILGDGYYESGDTGFFTYSNAAKNLGNLDPFIFGQEMQKIYKKCLASVRPGGTMTIIIQDYMRGHGRENLGELAMLQCIKMGWELSDYFQRYQPGTAFKAIHKKAGRSVVENEDVIILRRPR